MSNAFLIGFTIAFGSEENRRSFQHRIVGEHDDKRDVVSSLNDCFKRDFFTWRIERKSSSVVSNHTRTSCWRVELSRPPSQKPWFREDERMGPTKQAVAVTVLLRRRDASKARLRHANISSRQRPTALRVYGRRWRPRRISYLASSNSDIVSLVLHTRSWFTNDREWLLCSRCAERRVESESESCRI